MTTVDTLKRQIPGVEISTFIQFSENNPLNKKVKVIRCKVHPSKYYSLIGSTASSLNLLRCVIWNLLKKGGIDLNFLVNSRFLRHFKEADLVIDLSLDAYGDSYGLRSVIETSKEILISVCLKKPVMMYAQSLGPFKTPITRFLAKYTLNKVDLITAREEISYNNLIELGIKKNKIHLTADQAFLLEPISRDEALKIVESEDREKHFDSRRPTFGFAISMMKTSKDTTFNKNKIMMSGYSFIQYILPDTVCMLLQNKIKNSSYFKKIANKSLNFSWMDTVIEHLVKEYDANIILVPHIISLQYELFGDDRTAIKKIYDSLAENNKERVVPIQGYYASEEVKGIIGLCDIFIGEKMHANVGALSQCIPTLGLSYSHKFYGIMKMMGYEEYVMQNVDPAALISKVDKLWKNKEEIRFSLDKKMITIKEMAENNGKLAASLLKAQV